MVLQAAFEFVLRRVAQALHTRVRVVFEPDESADGLKVADSGAHYKSDRVDGIK